MYHVHMYLCRSTRLNKQHCSFNAYWDKEEETSGKEEETSGKEERPRNYLLVDQATPHVTFIELIRIAAKQEFVPNMHGTGLE